VWICISQLFGMLLRMSLMRECICCTCKSAYPRGTGKLNFCVKGVLSRMAQRALIGILVFLSIIFRKFIIIIIIIQLNYYYHHHLLSQVFFLPWYFSS
jgi:hypothetical protein